MSKPLATLLSVVLSIVALVSGACAQSLIPGGSWSGPYWGLTGGGAWNDVQQAREGTDLVWSGHAGYGVQLSNLYIGAEADVTYGGTRSTFAISPVISSTLEVDWSATARGRVGLAAAGLLFYVTAGAAWSGQSLAVHTLGGSTTSADKIIPGLVYGAGVEARVLPFVSVRLEALRYDYSSQAARFSDQVSGTITSGQWKSLDLDEMVVRAGISLRFN